MRRLHVSLLPECLPSAGLADAVAVVIDVLRATTTMAHALSAGALRVIPCSEMDEAREIASRLPPGAAVLGGERQGIRIDGFDLGNSPGEYLPAVVQGRTVVFTTTNGTRALARAREAGARRILIGAFCNRGAVVRELLAQSDGVHLICAGTDRQVTLEDVLYAGVVCQSLLSATGSWTLNDSARLALAAAEVHAPTPERLLTTLRQSLGGANLVELGFDRDIETAAWLDTFDFVPEFRWKDKEVPSVERV